MNQENIADLIEQLVKGNNEMMTMLRSMHPDDQRFFAPRVSKQIDETTQLVNRLTEEFKLVS